MIGKLFKNKLKIKREKISGLKEYFFSLLHCLTKKHRQQSSGKTKAINMGERTVFPMESVLPDLEFLFVVLVLGNH